MAPRPGRAGSELGQRRAAWRRAGGGLRPEERGRPLPRLAPARALAALGREAVLGSALLRAARRGGGPGSPRP